MVVNFRAYEINQGTGKLARILTLIIIIIKNCLCPLSLHALTYTRPWL